MTEGWICEGGHPYFMIDGEKVCPICVKIAVEGVRVSQRPCAGNHTRPMSHGNCRLCERYNKTPWQKELDLTGKATCPKGHSLTHEDLKYTHRQGKTPERQCGQCRYDRIVTASKAYIKKREEIAAAEGREVRRKNAPKKRLPAESYDWVVALRLIEGKVDEVYDMVRDEHKGATLMEQWIAYCSTTEEDNTRMIRHHSGIPSYIRPQWKRAADSRGWKPKTLAQAMSSL